MNVSEIADTNIASCVQIKYFHAHYSVNTDGPSLSFFGMILITFPPFPIVITVFAQI